MTLTETPSELRLSLEKHDASFTQLLSLIPARYYIVQEEGEDADTKWMKNKKKRPAEEVQAAKKKAKFEKMDPDNHKTIPQIQAERAAAATAAAASSSSSEMPISLPPSLKPMAPSVSITALRAKLQTKLDTFKSRKNTTGSNTSALGARPGEASSGAEGDEEGEGEMKSRDELMDETRRRRGEVRDARRRKRKEERRREKETPVKKGKVIERNAKLGDEAAVAGKKDAKGKGKEDFTTKAGRPSLLVDPLPFTSNSIASTVPESNVTFSLALPSTHKSPKSHIKTLSNPSQQLDHLARQKERLAALPEEKRKEIEEKERWAKAVERAEGGKVRDDEARLRKVVKRVEKEKGKSGKEWQDRKIANSAAAAAKAKKRNDNIASRIDAKRSKKLGLKPKGDKDKAKGKIFKGRDGTKGAGGYKGKKDDGRSKEGGGGGRPGFEGKGGGGRKGKN